MQFAKPTPLHGGLLTKFRLGFWQKPYFIRCQSNRTS